MTFYFYDLETSGLSSRAQRIMQFAGQRTDENFKPIGEPQNYLVKLTDEILPDPEAVLVTKITPQTTLQDGLSEAELLVTLQSEMLQPDTVIMGYNTVRFDDEFMRFTFWRNFYDPYAWQWQDGRSRWDLLDVVRMVRALRPEGINWPVDKDGKPTNRLELLTKLNKLDHQNAHDALNDVYASIGLAKLLKVKQPKIFDYLFSVRSKQAAALVVNPSDPQPFVYSSGRYSSKWQKTTVAVSLAECENGNYLVYDLRVHPDTLSNLSDAELMQQAFMRDEASEILPVKVLRLNSCPAIAPLGVFDAETQQRLGLSMETIQNHFAALQKNDQLITRLKTLHDKRVKAQKAKFTSQTDPEFQLYDGFIDNKDQPHMSAIRAASAAELKNLKLPFKDKRLQGLLPRYKARNYPSSLDEAEREAWEAYRQERLAKGLPGQLSLVDYVKRLQELATTRTDNGSQFVLQELQLWAESIMPTEV